MSCVAAKMLKSVCKRASEPVHPSQLCVLCVLLRRVRGGGGRVMGFPSLASIRLSLSILDN